jgi:hypothetical protein
MADIDAELQRLEAAPPWDWPANTADVLLERLRNDRAGDDERVLAARLAGEPIVANEALVGTLLEIVGRADEAEALRAQAAISLGPVLETVDVEGTDFPEDLPISQSTFREVMKGLRSIYADANAPKLVRRRILEAAVRAPQAWQHDAIAEAYASEDPEWQLTAVFSMRWVRGFADEILEALESGDDDLRYEAIEAAGSWQIDAAWPRILELLRSKDTEKSLRLAAIDAVASIRPGEAETVLVGLTESPDEDIAEAAGEAMAMAEAIEGEGFDFELEEEDEGSDDDDELDELDEDDEGLDEDGELDEDEDEDEEDGELDGDNEDEELDDDDDGDDELDERDEESDDDTER